MDFIEIQLEENRHSQYSSRSHGSPPRIVYDSQLDTIRSESSDRIFVTDSSRHFRINEQTNSEEQMTTSTHSG